MLPIEVQRVPAQLLLGCHEIVDIHRLLGRPDGLAELLCQLDCSEVAQAINCLHAHLRSAPQVDAVAVIDPLALLCADDDRLGQSSMRSLSRAVAAFVADCMQFVVDDDTEYVIIEFVGTVPLVYGFDFLCKVGAAHGLVHERPSAEFSDARW